MLGWVYIFTNPSMPGLVRVGFSNKDPGFRRKDFDQAGLPRPYDCPFWVLCEEPYQIEQGAHRILKKYHDNKEWFKCEPNVARAAILQLCDPVHKHDTIGPNCTCGYWDASDKDAWWSGRTEDYCQACSEELDRLAELENERFEREHPCLCGYRHADDPQSFMPEGDFCAECTEQLERITPAQWEREKYWYALTAASKKEAEEAEAREARRREDLARKEQEEKTFRYWRGPELCADVGDGVKG